MIGRRNKRVEAQGPNAPPAMALDTSCLLPRPPRCGSFSVTKTGGRRLTSRPTLNVLSRHSSALGRLRQGCGQLPRVVDQSFPLGGALSTPRTRFAVTPAAVVVVATPTILANTPTFAVSAAATDAASLLPPVLFCQLFLLGSAKR